MIDLIKHVVSMWIWVLCWYKRGKKKNRGLMSMISMGYFDGRIINVYAPRFGRKPYVVPNLEDLLMYKLCITLKDVRKLVSREVMLWKWWCWDFYVEKFMYRDQDEWMILRMMLRTEMQTQVRKNKFNRGKKEKFIERRKRLKYKNLNLVL